MEVVDGLENYKKNVIVTNHQLKTSNELDNPSVYQFQSEKNSGNYNFKFTIYDEKGRINTTNIDNFIVSGGKSTKTFSLSNKSVRVEKVELITNKSTYEPEEDCKQNIFFFFILFLNLIFVFIFYFR